MTTIFHIEGEEVLFLKNKLYDVREKYKVIGQTNILQTPYSSFSKSFDLEVSEEDKEYIINFINQNKGNATLRIYTKEKIESKGLTTFYYRPYVADNDVYATTYLFQKLYHPERFIEDFNDVSGTVYMNYLEDFNLVSQERQNGQGYYIASAYTLNNKKQLVIDSGIIEFECVENEEGIVLTSTLTNVRKRIGKNDATLYDYLMGIPLGSGVSKTRIKEYYLPFTEDFVIHFSEDSNRIEVYQKENNKINLVPHYIMYKGKIKSSFEQEIQDCINLFYEKNENQKTI